MDTDSINKIFEFSCTRISNYFILILILCVFGKFDAAVVRETPIDVLASRIITYRNLSYNPCDNFYGFACGGFYTANVTHPEKLYPSLVKKEVTDLIQNGGDHKEFKPFKLIDDLYKTCMDDNAVGLEALALLDRILKKLGNWPVFENGGWKESDFDWTDFTIGSKKLGLDINYFLDLKPWRVKEGNKTVVRYSIDIASGEFKGQILNTSDPLVTAYGKYIQSVFDLLKQKENSSKEIHEIIEFERQVSAINFRAQNYTEELKLEDLTTKWPTINWNELISNIILRNIKTPLEISKISLWSSETVSDFIDLLLKTPNRVKANYAVWKIIQKNVPYLTEKYRVLQREYCAVQTCKTEDRATSCVGVVKRHLAPAVNALYAKKYYNRDTEVFIENLVRVTKEELVKMINNSWMDERRKEMNIERVKNMEVVFGAMKDEELVKFYENLEIDRSNYLQTLLDLELIASETRFNETDFIREPRILLENYFLNDTDKIYLHWGYLRKPYFDINYPRYANHGSTGFMIAFSLVKLIDDLSDFSFNYQDLIYPENSGININYENNNDKTCFRDQWVVIRNSTWFISTDAQAIIVVLNSRISFQMATKLSYLTYRRFTAENTEEPPSLLNYTHQQLYWINSLQNICFNRTTNDPKAIDEKYTTTEFFFMQVLSSGPELYEDFKCSNGSYIKNYGPSCSYL